jgi:Mrp family chromosome partitioning ATPase/capsular polysaccharide biosynthesis protein
MTLEQYWTIMLKQWRLILACFLIVGLGAYLVSKVTTPVYQSTALVQVTVQSANSQADYNSLLASDQLVQTESELAISDPVLLEVASRYPGMTADELSKEVSTTVKPNTQLFEISVLDTHPARAAALANDVAATLIRQQIETTQQSNDRSRQQVQQEINTTQQQIDTITNQIATLQAQGGKQAQIGVLQVQLAGLQQHYSDWQTLLAQLELAQQQNGNLLRVVQPAQPARTPARPQVLLNTGAGLLAGLFLGVLLALLFEQLDTRVRSSEDLTRLLNWPVLATIWRPDGPRFGRLTPRLEALSQQANLPVPSGVWGPDPSQIELVNPRGHSPNVEAYRILRTNIGFSAVDKPLHTIMVVSAQPNDGKSTVAANLAIFMAKAGKQTLLVDADLRRPTLHEKFRLAPDKLGLSNVVIAISQLQTTTSAPSTHENAGHMEHTPSGFSLATYMHSVGIANLRVMPSGPLPPNPPELLDSKAMERLFTLFADSGAEAVILDTPPLLGLSDASILAPRVDGIIIVVDITRATKKQLVQLKTTLTRTGARVLGCVVNKQRHSRKDTAYSYYYYQGQEQRTREQRTSAPDEQDTVMSHHMPAVSPTTSRPLEESEAGKNGHNIPPAELSPVPDDEEGDNSPTITVKAERGRTTNGGM